MPTRVRQTGEGSAGFPALQTANPNTRGQTESFLFVRLKSHSGEQYPASEVIAETLTKLYQEQEQAPEVKRLQASLSPQRGQRLSNVSLERFQTYGKYRDRPAAADIAFCVAAYANGMTEDRIERALDEEYLSR
jgi:hypothetical protein